MLQDVAIPAELSAALGGPRHGIADLRRRVAAKGRALTCSAIKPQGLPPERLAELAARYTRGGIDFIRDDHGLANQAYSPFAETRRRDRRQRRPCYTVCAEPVGRPRQMRRQVDIARAQASTRCSSRR